MTEHAGDTEGWDEIENKFLPATVPEVQEQALVFGTDAPDQIIKRASAVSTELANIVEKCALYNDIKGRKHVRVEGWTTMLAMLNITPQTEWCRRIERSEETLYDAKVILVHKSGRIVGSGEALCSSLEANWGSRDEYAIKSMAQTRATGKAARLAFSWIMTLAGYDATPYEEMPKESKYPPKNTSQNPRKAVSKAVLDLLERTRDLAWAITLGDTQKGDALILECSTFPSEKDILDKDGNPTGEKEKRIITAKSIEHLCQSELWLNKTFEKVQARYTAWMRNEVPETPDPQE